MSRRLLQDLVEHAPVAICVSTGREHQVELANAACRHFTNPCRAVGIPLGALLPECASALASADAVAALRNGGSWTLRASHADPSSAERRWNWLCWTWAHGTPEQRIVLIGVDATPEVAALRASSDANRAKDELISQLLHELRAPLAPMHTALELLRLPEPQQHGHALAVLERQTKHLARLINDMAELSRAGQSGLTLNREWVELAGIVEQAVEFAMPLLTARRHTIRVAIARDLMLEVDPGRIVQVVANLVINAAKYTDDGGSIDLVARRVGDQAVLSVRDNGIGISPAMLPHIFEMFVRAPRARKSREGFGLGLNIVQALVCQHGGSVEARSDGPGCGSEFIVILPCRERPGHLGALNSNEVL